MDNDHGSAEIHDYEAEQDVIRLSAALTSVAERDRLAQAWDEGLHAGARWTPTQWGPHKPLNPYRTPTST